MLLSSLAISSQSPYLFPNLRVLKWQYLPVEDPYLAVTMHQLLSPALVSVSALSEWTSNTQLFLQNYVQLSPRLKLNSLRLFVGVNRDFSEAEIHQLSLGISTQECLECLEVHIPIDDVALRGVMLSPQLRVAILVLHPIASSLSNIHITSADIPFRNVKELELYVRDLHFVSRLLRWQDQMFKTFRLRFTALDNTETFFALFTALASPQRTDSLQSIRLTCDNPYVPAHDNTSYDHSVHCLAYRTLSPLASLKHLRKLELILRNPIHLDDGELGELARNWPMLESLTLTCTEGFYGTSVSLGASVSLGGLSLLLTHCARLRDLSLSIDAREVPETTKIDVCNMLDISIELPDSPIRDARLVADFFSKHLPSVTDIEVPFADASWLSGEPVEEYESLWSEVNDYLRAAKVGIYSPKNKHQPYFDRSGHRCEIWTLIYCSCKSGG